MDTGEKAVSSFAALILGPAAIIAEGYVLVKLWAWFIVPTFGSPALTLNTAVGIALMWGFLSIKRRDWWPFEKDDDKTLVGELSKVIYPFLIPWFVLLAGWIVLAFK